MIDENSYTDAADIPSAVGEPEMDSQLDLHGDPEILDHLTTYIEALLFVSPGEVHPSQLAAALEVPLNDIERGLDLLARSYTESETGRGLRLQHYRGRYQLVSMPEAARWIERFLGLESSNRLSRAAMETLAIILYRQPITRPQIEAIRGVNSDYILHSLLLKGLVQEVGRSESPGRPILYTATSDCLQYFGLTSLTQLPPLDLESQ